MNTMSLFYKLCLTASGIQILNEMRYALPHFRHYMYKTPMK